MASPYIEAARSIGAGDRPLMLHYVLPNVFPLTILRATLRLGGVVLIEASLSFLGFGLPPPFHSWGQRPRTAVDADLGYAGCQVQARCRRRSTCG